MLTLLFFFRLPLSNFIIIIMINKITFIFLTTKFPIKTPLYKFDGPRLLEPK